jgi:predicted dehydrogenase
MQGRKLNVLVVGGGSVGKRHVRNLLALGARVAVFRYRGSVNDELQSCNEIEFVPSLDLALKDIYDGVVIANQTSLHIDVALAAARAGKHLFIEKPLSVSLQGVGELADLVSAAGLVVEAGFVLRRHPSLRYLKTRLDAGCIGVPLFARAMVGQYLPDWRPDTDYRQSYSARRDAGGGVIFDLVHELDLILWLLGEVEEVATMTAQNAELAIETEAVAQIGMRLKSSALAQIHLDYLRPGYARTLEIIGSAGSLAWDYVEGVVKQTGRTGGQEVVHSAIGFDRNEMFLDYMRCFLLRIAGQPCGEVASLEDGVRALKLALACHKSAQERQFVRLDQIH